MVVAKNADTKPLTQKEWLALAKKGRAADLDTLLASLFDATMREVIGRLPALEKRKADPRVARTLTDAVVDPPFASTSSKKMWQPLFELLTGVGDAAALARLAPIVDGYDHKIGAVVMGPWMKTRLAALVAALEKRHGPAKKVASKSESKSQLAAPAKTKTGTTDSLFDDVIANPDDDDARAVLGDALQQAGDPRGEFIALQLRRAHKKRGEVSVITARETELLTAHRQTWLSPLFDVIDVEDAVFERGFLAKAHVVGHPASKVAKTAGLPIWATVRELHSGATTPLAVILHPVMRALRTVDGVNAKAFCALANHATPLPFETVSTRLDQILDKPKKDVALALTEAPGLPRLKRIHVEHIPISRQEHLPRFDFFWKGALAARLETFSFDTWLIAEWINHLLQIGIEHPTRVIVRDTFELTRTKPGGRLDALAIRDSLEDKLDVLSVLAGLEPKRAASITCELPRIEKNAKDRASLAKALARLRG